MDLLPVGGLPLPEVLAQELPRWAQASLPGLGSLAAAAKDPSLSEWHFVLPLGRAGLDGRGLARAFEVHADPELRGYAATLAALSPEAVHGLLQGYIDRLVRVGGDWGVVDWKSNKLGDHAGDFSRGRLFEEAAGHHYILQLYFYLLALRRHLRRRGGDFRLSGAYLVFLRALRAHSADGILHFPADPGVLDRLDALFAGPEP
jgi:ATP-dependent exoDNAse (exonuclease V) beta subunit